MLHLQQRDADKRFYIGWLSKLHQLGFEQDIFDPEFRAPKQSKTQKKAQILDLQNDDQYFNVMAGRIKVKHLKQRKSYALTKVDRIAMRIELAKKKTNLMKQREQEL